jgi:hypothetical protein
VRLLIGEVGNQAESFTCMVGLRAAALEVTGRQLRLSLLSPVCRGASEPTKSDDIRNQDRRELPNLAHRALLSSPHELKCQTQSPVRRKGRF